MPTDRQGNPLPHASGEAADRFAAALEAFNLYRGDPVGLLDEALAESPDFAMATIMKAALFATSTEPAATAAAGRLLDRLDGTALDAREASHVAAIRHIVAGDWTAAGTAFDHHNIAFPRDLLALQVGHLTDFMRGNARNLRDRIARVLPHWPVDTPGRSILLGMHAFGLEETGDYARAEALGREAVEAQPLDCWAHHAVAHVLEMQGRPAEGLRWMQTREPHWAGEDNFLEVHNWWHRALCHLELGEPARALALYDARIARSTGAAAVDLVDASALLWRLTVTGTNVGDRWQPLAAAWDAHADGRLYPFNDWHAAMAFLGAGRTADVDRILTAYRGLDAGREASRWAIATGRPLIEGFAAFWRGDHEAAAIGLHAARFVANSFGGSHAQRDIIDWTMTEAAIRAGRRDLATAFAAERLALRPHSPVNKAFLDRASTRKLAA